MLGSTTVEVIRLIPSFLWAVLAVVVVLALRKPFLAEIMPRIGGVRILGVEITLLEGALTRAVEHRGEAIDKSEKSALFRRARLVARTLQGAYVLWVDDEPDNNIEESRILRSLGIGVDAVTSNERAMSKLSRAGYDLVISDIKRPEGPGGLRLLEAMRRRGDSTALIFYVGTVEKPLPEGAFGITNRPDELLHLVMDVVERKRA